VHEGLPRKNFDSPTGLTTATVCINSGKLPGEKCTETSTGQFFASSLPHESCDYCGVPGKDPNAVEEPETPVTPEAPVTPETPVTPSTPSEPSTPPTEETPSTPETPVDPPTSEPEKPSEDTSTEDKPAEQTE